MPNENLNNWQSVADKLDGLEILPADAPLDRAAAWNKLAIRLQPPSRRRSLLWWAAAVVLLFGFGGTALLRISSWKNTAAAKNTRIAKPVQANGMANDIPQLPAANLSDAQAAGSNPTFTGIPAPNPEKSAYAAHRTIRAKTSLENKRQQPTVAFFAKNNRRGPDTINKIATEPNVRFAALKTDPASGTTVATTSKRVRVVYLNELDAPAPQALQENPFDSGLLTARRRNPLRLDDLSLHSVKHQTPVSAPPSLFSINLNRGE